MAHLKPHPEPQPTLRSSQLVVEPSGAVGLAAALSRTWGASAATRDGKRVGVVLCGGNVDLGSKGFWDLWLPRPEDKED